jgi:16S rRNA (guanine527-N7)-methyltransferase
VTSQEFQDRLAGRAATASLSLAAEVAARLEAYYRVLAAWNRKINLTGLDLETLGPEAIDRLFIEPVAAAAYGKPHLSVIDIGSGGGSPAIPLALAMSASRLVMVESRTRKSIFLREAARAVELNEARVEGARFETLTGRPDLVEAHDILSIRAVRVDSAVLSQLQRFVKPKGAIFLFQAAPARRRDLPAPLISRGHFALLHNGGSELEIVDKANH